MATDWVAKLGISLDDLRRQVFNQLFIYDYDFAEEVLAEILLRLTRILGAEPEKFASPDALYRYARRSAAREAWHQKNHAFRQQPTDPVAFADLAAPAPAQADGPTKEDALEWLNDPLQREIVRLHLEGVQGKVIAKVVGLHPSRVSILLSNARHQLSTRYANERRTS